ncbi:MAG: gluconokinase [Actinomycetota bacterium]
MATPVIVMGVSASGKSAVGQRLATALRIPFVDGDDLHPPSNVAKMRAGEPLTDADRAPWLDVVGSELAQREVVVACSALKVVYRERLRHTADRPIRFVHLDVREDELRRRIETRTDHFMPSSLLRDQLETLEWPGDEPDVVILAADQEIDRVVADAIAAVTPEVPPRQ